jgi:hypothetical protein
MNIEFQQKKITNRNLCLYCYYLSIDNLYVNTTNMSISTIKTLGEFMADCARTTHRLSCYAPLPSHATQV